MCLSVFRLGVLFLRHIENLMSVTFRISKRTLAYRDKLGLVLIVVLFMSSKQHQNPQNPRIKIKKLQYYSRFHSVQIKVHSLMFRVSRAQVFLFEVRSWQRPLKYSDWNIIMKTSCLRNFPRSHDSINKTIAAVSSYCTNWTCKLDVRSERDAIQRRGNERLLNAGFWSLNVTNKINDRIGI